MLIEIVDLPINKNGDFPWFSMIFHSYLSVYRRLKNSHCNRRAWSSSASSRSRQSWRPAARWTCRKTADSTMTYQQNMRKMMFNAKKKHKWTIHQNDMIFLFKTTTQNIKDIWNIEKLQSTVYNGKLTTEFGEERSDSIDEKSRIQYDSVVKQESSDTWNSRAEPKSKPGFDRQKKNDVCDQTQNNQTYEYSICNIQQSGFDAERTILTTKWLLQSGPADAMS